MLVYVPSILTFLSFAPSTSLQMLAADKEFTRAASAHLAHSHASPRGPDGIAPLALASRLVSAFHTLDDAVLAASAAQGSRDGSTALVALRCGQHLYTAHVGDTRAVAVIAQPPPPPGGDVAGDAVVPPTSAVRLTRDHTASCGIEAARVRAAGGSLHYVGCWRVIADDIINAGGNGGPSLRAALAVTRALGDAAFKRRSRGPLVHSASAASLPSLNGAHSSGLQQTVLATPDVARLHLKRDVVCVVCATDGLWDALSDDDAAEVALHALATCSPGPAMSAASKAQVVADALIAASLEVRRSLCWTAPMARG